MEKPTSLSKLPQRDLKTDYYTTCSYTTPLINLLPYIWMWAQQTPSRDLSIKAVTWYGRSFSIMKTSPLQKMREVWLVISEWVHKHRGNEWPACVALLQGSLGQNYQSLPNLFVYYFQFDDMVIFASCSVSILADIFIYLFTKVIARFDKPKQCPKWRRTYKNTTYNKIKITKIIRLGEKPHRN